MEALRSVEIPGSPRTGGEGRVGSQLLAGRRPRQQRANVKASSTVGTTFSRLAMTMCMRGRPCVSSALPSLVTVTAEPVSAIRKLAPVMPTSASR